MAGNAALIGAALLLGLACLASACVALRLLVPDPRQQARLRAERIERLFRDEGAGEGAGEGDGEMADPV